MFSFNQNMTSGVYYPLAVGVWDQTVAVCLTRETSANFYHKLRLR